MKTQHVDGHVSDRLGDHLEGDLSLAEFARVDAHLAVCGDCADELRELRGTVALLRGLPDPEPPSELIAAVMSRIESGAGRPRRVVAGFRRISEPRFAAGLAAVAAGVAGLMLFTSSEFGSESGSEFASGFGSGSFLGTPPEPALGSVAMRSDSRSVADVRAMEARRPLPLPRAPAARALGMARRPVNPLVTFAAATPTRYPEGIGFFGNAAPEAPLRDLDGELEALMADPAAFLERFRRTAEDARGPIIAPLVEHSARRGDASAVARMAGIAARPVAVPVSSR